jgi:hypothetical protein
MSIANPVAELPHDARAASHVLYKAVQDAGVEWARLENVAVNAEGRGDQELAGAARTAAEHVRIASRSLQDAYSQLYLVGIKRAKKQAD